jgi:hypothetical protein
MFRFFLQKSENEKSGKGEKIAMGLEKQGLRSGPRGVGGIKKIWSETDSDRYRGQRRA